MPRLDEIQIRDPYVVDEDGCYYLFGSTDPDIWKADGIGFDAYRGVAPGVLTELEGPFPAFRPPAGFWSRRNFWAPEVHAWQGAHYLFATFLPVDGRRGTAVLRSTGGILGPYEPWSDGPVTPPEWETLDGTLHVDPAGRPWMVFCHEWQQVGDGTVEAMRLTEDLRAAASPPVTLFSASQAPWAAPLAGRAPGSYVTDGPFVYRNAAGVLKCLWSSFGPEGDYRIGEATSSGGILGDWTQAPEPVFAADGGHGMLFDGPDGTRYLAVHTPNATPRERAVFVEVVEDAAGDLRATGRVVR
ncbi:glycoside hydrolase family 43 protein [Xylanimonas protaetiae]|uniref:Glycoside hydrolase n=1 Tax=Xylanimonas protaetiae TaxID=2509457 RepID=A0A4P6F6W8_9MICO|nr:glycoside hydrolase family 43 protein [Xylanimonas protaetiae]QAY68977.1 glycoside hydrolase [Xylanimonas protaetiae]